MDLSWHRDYGVDSNDLNGGLGLNAGKTTHPVDVLGSSVDVLEKSSHTFDRGRLNPQ